MQMTANSTAWLIGLTGGIGSGKSRVANLLGREPGFATLDADRIALELFSGPGPALSGLAALVGGRYFLADGRLDRPLLRQAIFADPELRQAVDRYAHPLIWEMSKQHILACQEAGSRYVVVEVPLLFEAGWQGFFQRIVVVYADERTCMARLTERDTLSMAQAKLACDAQQPLVNKVVAAHHVINNNGWWCDTVLQVKRLSRLIAGKNA